MTETAQSKTCRYAVHESRHGVDRGELQDFWDVVTVPCQTGKKLFRETLRELSFTTGDLATLPANMTRQSCRAASSIPDPDEPRAQALS